MVVIIYGHKILLIEQFWNF